MSNPTSNFGWQMPTATDLVTDLPADFEVFGQAVDTSMADLKGGTTGQILSKASSTDMDFTWITNDIGDITAVTATSPLTGGGTSGAITVGIQSGTTSQLGAVQLTDSTSSTSTTTAATPNSVKNVRMMVQVPSGSYLMSPNGSASSSSTPTINTTFFLPIYIPISMTVDRIAMQTAAAFVGTSNGSVRLGIYNDSNGAPGTVLLDAGTVTTAAASTVYAITISQALTPGIYWVAGNVITAATTNSLQVFNASTGNPLMGAIVPSGSLLSATRAQGYQQSVNATSGFATASSLTLNTANAIQIGLRAA